MSDGIEKTEDEAPKAESSAELSELALDAVVGGNVVSGTVSRLPIPHKPADITLKRG